MIRGQGMPTYRHHDFGNMYIKFDVKFPDKHWTEDESAFEALRKLLPSPPPLSNPPTEAMMEVADLEDVDGQSGSRGFAAGGGSAMEEDGEDGEPQAERVQCASQ